MNSYFIRKIFLNLAKSTFYAALLIFVLVTACSQSSSSANETAIPEEGLNILFIGNSLTYTNDLPGMLLRMLEFAEVDVGLIDVQAYPNYGLPDHWINTKTRTRLSVPGWDVVILQQGPSATEGRPYLLEYTKLFAEEIRKSGGRPALYMVWPSMQRIFDFNGVSDSYRTAAKEVDGLLFPAGEAWQIAWSKDPDLKLYSSDGFHPSQLGTYLAALVMFEQLADKDPHILPAKILTKNGDVSISESLAKLLQDAAQEANAGESAFKKTVD